MKHNTSPSREAKHSTSTTTISSTTARTSMMLKMTPIMTLVRRNPAPKNHLEQQLKKRWRAKNWRTSRTILPWTSMTVRKSRVKRKTTKLIWMTWVAPSRTRGRRQRRCNNNSNNRTARLLEWIRGRTRRTTEMMIRTCREPTTQSNMPICKLLRRLRNCSSISRDTNLRRSIWKRS